MIDQKQTPSLIHHLERFFGTIERGWLPGDQVQHDVQIIEFGRGRVSDATVLSTLGLSNFVLKNASNGKLIRQEMFLMMLNGQLHPQLPAVLEQIAKEQILASTPILRGQVIKKIGTLVPGRQFNALYATLPIYYDQELWTCDIGLGPPVAVCWLLPLLNQEVSYISANGWSAFEDRIDSAPFDLFDLARESLV